VKKGFKGDEFSGLTKGTWQGIPGALVSTIEGYGSPEVVRSKSVTNWFYEF
jgi:hypothetical protein